MINTRGRTPEPDFSVTYGAGTVNRTPARSALQKNESINRLVTKGRS